MKPKFIVFSVFSWDILMFSKEASQPGQARNMRSLLANISPWAYKRKENPIISPWAYVWGGLMIGKLRYVRYVKTVTDKQERFGIKRFARIVK